MPLVALVVEVGDDPAARVAARGARERGDGAGLLGRNLLDDRIEGEGLLGEDERPAGDRRNQRDDVAVGKSPVDRRVFLVDGVEQPLGLIAEVELAPHLADAVCLQLARRPSGPLAQTVEESHRHTHPSTLPPWRRPMNA